MSGPLHLLRGMPPNVNGRPITFEKFKRLVPLWKGQGSYFGSWTRYAPRRVDEFDDDSSVYFVTKGETLFRMPLLGIEPVRGHYQDVEPRFLNHVAIACAPEIVMVAAHKVRCMRGWRYLADADAPPAMARELREMGLE